MMQFIFFIFAIAAATPDVSLPGEDLFSAAGSSSTDLLFPSEISSGSGNLFLDKNNNNNGDDLLADSTVNPTTDFTSGLGNLEDASSDFLASCPSSTNGQSESKLRARDGVCAQNGQPSSIDGFIDNTLGIFGSPSDGEEQLQRAAAAASAKNTDPACNYVDNEYPFHLCCATKGKKSKMVLPTKPNTGWFGSIMFNLRRDIYETMEDCQLGT